MKKALNDAPEQVAEKFAGKLTKMGIVKVSIRTTPVIILIFKTIIIVVLENIILNFMKTEKEKMLDGELYDALDEQLCNERTKARLLIQKLNSAGADDNETVTAVLKELIPNAGENLWIQPPFFCDYGYNIEAGEKVFFNFNCVVLDVMKVSIGSRTLFGPNVQIYTATHPLDYIARANGLEYAKPIAIGEDVWIGGSVVICPGVTIGDRCVIGAGSVVTKSIPDDVFAAGNPCKVIRSLKQKL